MQLESVPRCFEGRRVVVAATGPSLTSEVAALCRDEIVIAVNDAWKVMPWATILYACDNRWWEHYQGCPDFTGQRWSTHSLAPRNDKTKIADLYRLHVVSGAMKSGFSGAQNLLHYGENSGFQAVNLALLTGARPIVLVGFDMHQVAKKTHFFGDHPEELRRIVPFHVFVRAFDHAARDLAKDIRILNATPGSALRCFPIVDLAETLGRREAA